MEKIGIVTIIDYYNFGNRLQNYALCFLLNKRLGCKAITLEAYKEPFFQGSIFVWIKEQLALQLCRIPSVADKRLNPKAIRWFNFSEWSRKNIPRTRYYSCEQLSSELDKKYDCFIAGSDQVWNCRIKSLRLHDFLLSFASDKKKNSVSASFGLDHLPDDQKETYKKALSKFAHISVREESGARIIKDLIGIDVPVLIDPVMALSKEEWINVEKKPRIDITKPYLLKYYLGEDDESIDSWADEHGYIVYELMNEKKPELYSAGPGEFISLVRNASLVCSDSFHCIAFSILFSRPFIVFARKGTENYMASRLETLLAKFGFEHRWFHLLAPEEYLKCDFSSVSKRIKNERRTFMDYLKKITRE